MTDHKLAAEQLLNAGLNSLVRAQLAGPTGHWLYPYAVSRPKRIVQTVTLAVLHELARLAAGDDEDCRIRAFLSEIGLQVEGAGR